MDRNHIWGQTFGLGWFKMTWEGTNHIVTKIYFCEAMELFIWTADSNSAQQYYLAKQRQHYQSSSVYVSNFLSSAMCQHHCSIDRWCPACDASRLSFSETLYIAVFFLSLQIWSTVSNCSCSTYNEQPLPPENWVFSLHYFHWHHVGRRKSHSGAV